MDNRTFTSTLNRALGGTETKLNARLVDILAEVLADAAAESDTIAIPGFGSFVPRTTDEHIELDAETGRRRLIPPSLTVSFEPASRLKKAISRK